ncbi:MAG: hypothetical protein Q9174_001823 [Haloplaca sp. 1 TL-2023]
MSRHNRRRGRANHRNSPPSSQLARFELPSATVSADFSESKPLSPTGIVRARPKKNDLSARHWHNRYMAWQTRERRQKEERDSLMAEQRRIFGGESGEDDEEGLFYHGGGGERLDLRRLTSGTMLLMKQGQETKPPLYLHSILAFRPEATNSRGSTCSNTNRLMYLFSAALHQSLGVHYCSQKCQTTDWKFHKHLCAQFRDLEDRPSTNHVLAVYFPEHEQKPQLIWIAKKEEVVDIVDVARSLEPVVWLRDEHVRNFTQQTTSAGDRRQRKIAMDKMSGLENDKSGNNQVVYLLVRKDNLQDGSRPNKSIGTVTKGRTPFSWRGPVLAVLTKEALPPRGNRSVAESFEDSYVTTHTDMALIDYRDLIDFFAEYGGWKAGEEDFAPDSLWWESPTLRRELEYQERIAVVRVSCNVEHRVTSAKWAQAACQPSHPAWAFLQPLPITVKLGLPVVMRRLPSNPLYKAEAEAAGNRNIGPDFLLLNPEMEGDKWLTVHEQLPYGPVMIMRQDKKHLHLSHVYSMCTYISDVVLPAMEEVYAGKREKGEVLEMLHPSRLHWFFKRVCKEVKAWEHTPDLFEDLPSEPARDAVHDRLEGPMQRLQVTAGTDNEVDLNGGHKESTDHGTIEDPIEHTKENYEDTSVKKIQNSLKENVKESPKESPKEDHMVDHQESNGEDLKGNSNSSSKEGTEREAGQVLKQVSN